MSGGAFSLFTSRDHLHDSLSCAVASPAPLSLQAGDIPPAAPPCSCLSIFLPLLRSLHPPQLVLEAQSLGLMQTPSADLLPHSTALPSHSFLLMSSLDLPSCTLGHYFFLKLFPTMKKPPPPLKPPFKHSQATPALLQPPQRCWAKAAQVPQHPTPCAQGAEPALAQPCTLQFLPAAPNWEAAHWHTPVCVGHTSAEPNGMRTAGVWVPTLLLMQPRVQLPCSW